MIRFLSINSARPLADGSVDPTYTEGRGRRSGSGKKQLQLSHYYCTGKLGIDLVKKRGLMTWIL